MTNILILKEKNEMIKSLLTGLLIITLMLIFSSSINAECKKDEILKLINAGYNKTEISELCENKEGSKSTTTPTPGDNWTDPVSGMEFIFVPGGCFKMGSNSGDGDEKPIHEVCLDGFWMGKYEVTQGQWKRIMGNNPSYFRLGDNFPVESVSWNDIKKFVVLLKEHTGKKFSLPTEAQWEYAARSGGKSFKMLGKNYIDKIAWYKDNSGALKKNGGSAPNHIGTKAPNELGIYDMCGNVWEWCEDVYDENGYSKHSRENPFITSGGKARVKRGGGFGNEPFLIRPENRGQLSANFMRQDLGLRICLSEIQ